MIGSFGKAKKHGGGGKGKPLAQLTYKQLEKRETALQSLVTAGTATAKQSANLAKASTILAKRDARYTAKHPEHAAPPPAEWRQATFPTAAPPEGHRWAYSSSTNTYIPEAVPISSAGGGGYTYSGGGGGAPIDSFSQYAYDPYQTGSSIFGQDAAATPQPGTISSVLGAPQQGGGFGGAGKFGLIAAAGIAAYLIFRKKPRLSARDLGADR